MEMNATGNAQPDTQPVTSDMYHSFRLDANVSALTQQMIDLNKDNKVEMHVIERVKTAALSLKNITAASKVQLKTLWTKINGAQQADKSLFGTHLELDNHQPIKRLLRSLQPWFRSGSQYDLLKYALHRLSGINEVQFFVKGQDAWTGLHGEDCRLGSFNINLGPSDSKWFFIHAKHTDKLAELAAKHFPDMDIKKIEAHWHQFFFSAESLEQAGIPFEVLVQKPGTAVYVAGHALHQVVNSGPGLNIAWNVAIFSFETLVHITSGYNFEVCSLAKKPVVPVPRIVHIALFKYWSTFSQPEALALANFLFEHFKREQDEFNAFFQSRKESCVLTSMVVGNEHPVNNCLKCTRDFYLRAVCTSANAQTSFLCYACAETLPKTKEFSLVLFTNVDRVAQVLDQIRTQSQPITSKAPEDPALTYSGQGSQRLERFEFWRRRLSRPGSQGLPWA